MLNSFSPADPRRGNAPQTKGKSLETKLAILLHEGARSAKNVHRSSPAELNLFGANGARKYLTRQERERFQCAVQTLDPAKRLFCQVLLCSGGRVSEVLSVTPAAVDIDSGVIVLITLKRRNKQVVRQIPIPYPVVHALDEHFHLRCRQGHAQKMHGRLWPWSRSTAWRTVKKVMQEIGITTHAASPKGLRHTFGVTAFQAKVPPHLVQRWLGHASLRTTSIYGNVSGDEEREIAEQMWRKAQPAHDMGHRLHIAHRGETGFPRKPREWRTTLRAAAKHFISWVLSKPRRE